MATFIVIELAVFPLGCGVMLDFCTLQLFPDASVHSRMSFFAYAPVTATFYHWMGGTMFMFVLLSFFCAHGTDALYRYQFAIMLGKRANCIFMRLLLICFYRRMPENLEAWRAVVHQGSPGPELPPYSRYS